MERAMDNSTAPANEIIDLEGSTTTSQPTGEEVHNGTDGEEDNGPNSSFENIVPIQKIMNGWGYFGGLLATTVDTVSEKAAEAYNSENVMKVRQKTTEVVGPAWEKTKEVTVPIWEQTKAGATSAAESTRDNFNAVKEKAKPTFDQVSAQVQTGAAAGWQSVTTAASKAAEYTAEGVAKISEKVAPRNPSEAAQPVSAMDSATKGGPIVL